MKRKIVIVSGCCIVVFIIFLPSYTKIQDLKQRNIELEQQIKRLQAQQARLKRERRLLFEDPVYSEKIAREKMGIAKKGEVIYQLIPNKKDK